MNLTDCALKQMGERWVLDASDFNLDMTSRVHQIQSEAMGQELLLGVRPEDIMLLDSPANSRFFEAQVELTQNFGDERVVTIRVGKVSLNCLTGKERVFTYGQKVYVKLKEEKAYVFHGGTGIAVARSTN